jgi:hypothetical protein
VTIEGDTRDEAAIEAALLRCAIGLVQDPAEAQALVELTLAGAAPVAPLSEMQLFRLLRQTYHSIERSRRRRPMRDALVTSLARERRPAGASQDD